MRRLNVMNNTDFIDVDNERRGKFERLVRDHQAFVCRSAQYLGVPSADVEDVVQEVFILAARNLDEIRHESAFLYQSCCFVAGHMRRRTQRCREIIDDERVHAEIDSRASPEQVAAASEARAALEMILEAMPQELSIAFVLFEIERLTMTEIAQTVGVPVGTVASRLRRARASIMVRTKRDSRDACPRARKSVGIGGRRVVGRRAGLHARNAVTAKE
jgi:RNA polymerase sigma-70 factor (ECF subfamily)